MPVINTSQMNCAAALCAALLCQGAFAQASYVYATRSASAGYVEGGSVRTSSSSSGALGSFSYTNPSGISARTAYQSNLSPQRMTVTASGRATAAHLGAGYWPVMNSSASFTVQFSIDSPTPYRLRASGGNRTLSWGHDIASAWVRLYQGNTVLMSSEATRPTSTIDIAQELSRPIDVTGVLPNGVYTLDASFLASGHAEFSASGVQTGANDFSVDLELPAPSTALVSFAGMVACVGRRRRSQASPLRLTPHTRRNVPSTSR